MTPAQGRTLDTIAAFVAEHGYAPTLRDLCRALGETGTNGVNEKLVRLERAGFLRRTPGVARSIVLLSSPVVIPESEPGGLTCSDARPARGATEPAARAAAGSLHSPEAA